MPVSRPSRRLAARGALAPLGATAALLALVLLGVACSIDPTTATPPRDAAPRFGESGLPDDGFGGEDGEEEDGIQGAKPTAGNRYTSESGLGCLTGGPSTGVLAVSQCSNGAANQAWAAAPIGGGYRLSTYGALCAIAYAPAAVNGPVGAAACSSASTYQQWTFGAAGEIRSSTGFCATAVSANGKGLVVLRACDGSAPQRWRSSGSAPPPPPPVSPTTITLPNYQFGDTITAGESIPVSSSLALDAQNAPITWISSAAYTAMITATGPSSAIVRGIAPGITTLIASNGTSTQRAQVLVRQTTAPVPTPNATTLALPNGLFGDTILIGEIIAVGSSLPRKSNSAPISWVSSAAYSATVTSTGLYTAIVRGVAPGITTLIASNGTSTQRAQVLVVRPYVPMPSPPGPPPVTGVAAVSALLGATPSVASVEARGGAWATYERNFRQWNDSHWSTDGSDWLYANMYDRAMIDYVWWARTGSTKYRDRANAIALDYRTRYLAPNDYIPAPHWSEPDGVTLHYLVTGDPVSWYAVGRIADAYVSYIPVLWNNQTQIDNRTQAAVLVALLDADFIDAPSRQGHNWAAQAKAAVDAILRSQSADGAYRFIEQCNTNKPWMTGLLNEALIRYATTFDDPRILPSVRKAVDYMWTRNWRPQDASFASIGLQCVRPWGTEGVYGAAEANMMIVSAIGWLATETGNDGYLTIGDSVFAGGLARSYFPGSKTYNEVYTSSYRYLQHRW